MVGCDSYGKSLLLENIELYCQKTGIPYIKYDASDYRIARALHMGQAHNDTIMNSLQQFAAQTGKKIRCLQNNHDEFWILMHVSAVGISIDQINQIKQFLHMLKNGLENIKTYIVLSVTAYEFVYKEQCMDPVTGNVISFRNYEEYRLFIMDSKLHVTQREIIKQSENK